MSPARDDPRWHPRLNGRVCPPGDLAEVCTCGSATFEEKRRGDRTAVRCASCGDVELEPSAARILLGDRDFEPTSTPAPVLPMRRGPVGP